MLPFYILWRQQAPHFASLHANSQDRMAGPVTSEDYTRISACISRAAVIHSAKLTQKEVRPHEKIIQFHIDIQRASLQVHRLIFFG